MNSFEKLVYWQKARQLTKEIYSLTSLFPKEEQYGLSAQIRRAAVSISSNIAEGYGRQYRADYIHFLNVSRGSCYEVMSQLLLCIDLGFIQEQQAKKSQELCEEIGKMLNSAIQSLQNK
ncbi:MAG: four helix bundle protein [Oscillospiraceae bacterium]|nr:four helix bundle protein [Oscillospiraceae bacterium]MBR4194456.1 four helix bundle protein [Oscillospiraceae bacterium]